MAYRYKYSDEEIEFVREISPGRYNDEITDLFNKEFNTQVTESQIKSLKGNHSIRSGVPTRRRGRGYKLFTEEQEKFIKNNVKGLYNYELADLVSEKFNLNITADQINAFKNRHKLRSGINARFKKGHKSWNKGLKGLDIGGKETRFKKGQKPLNYRPVGSERICSKDGYTLIKVQDEGSYPERWKLKHQVIWEEVNGPVPEDHVLLFADQDKRNISLDNLILISRAQLALLNKNNLLHKKRELTELGITMADIHLKIGERKKEKIRNK